MLPEKTPDLRQEGAWARGWADTKRGLADWRFWVAEVVGGGVVAMLVEHALAVVASVLGMAVCLWVGATASAPVRQRDEARGEVFRLRAAQMQRPTPRLELCEHRHAWWLVIHGTAVEADYAAMIDFLAVEMVTKPVIPVHVYWQGTREGQFTRIPLGGSDMCMVCRFYRHETRTGHIFHWKENDQERMGQPLDTHHRVAVLLSSRPPMAGGTKRILVEIHDGVASLVRDEDLSPQPPSNTSQRTRP